MKHYKINWTGESYGESYVDAKNKLEADEKGKTGEDTDFEVIAEGENWTIESIVEVDEDFNEIE